MTGIVRARYTLELKREAVRQRSIINQPRETSTPGKFIVSEI